MFKAIMQKDTLLIWRNGEVLIEKPVADLNDAEVMQDLLELSYLFGVLDTRDKVEEIGARLMKKKEETMQ
jgi:hypothetical protein